MAEESKGWRHDAQVRQKAASGTMVQNVGLALGPPLTSICPPTRSFSSLDFRRRQQKLVQSNRRKTGPGKAVAGRPVASVA
jgi:hypothetical protein